MYPCVTFKPIGSGLGQEGMSQRKQRLPRTQNAQDARVVAAQPKAASAKAVAGKAASGGKPGRGPAGSEAMSHRDEAVATEIARNAYSRDRYQFLLRSLFGLMGILAVSVTGNVYLGLQQPENRYFATDPMGGIRELIPLERPIQSMNEVLNWATGALTQAYTMSFANYRESLQEVRPHFTRGGWIGFEEALHASGVIDSIVNGKLVATAVPQEAPVVVAQGIVEGRYAWKIQMPILVTYESANQRSSQRTLVTATVVRVSELEHPRGLGIAQIIAQ